MDAALVKCVDHLTVQVSPPEPLFAALTQQLLLPEAWPLNTGPFYTSGAVRLGNLNLEVMQTGTRHYPARLHGLGLELTSLEEALPALEERGIPHTPPLPYFVFDEQGWQVTAWTSVYLGGLLGGSPLAGLFFRGSRAASQEAWERAAMPTSFNRRFSRPFVFQRVFRSALVSGVYYNPVWRAAAIRPQPARPGLDVQGVYEITVGVRGLEAALPRWRALLEGHREAAPGVFSLPEGIFLRLIPHARGEIVGMIWRVASVNRAAQFLHRRKMLGEEIDGILTIAPEAVGGLRIGLVQ